MNDQKDIKTLQAEGRGPAPCARFCEAKAFRIEIAGWKRDQSENLKNQCKLVDQITALTAERDALTAANKDLQDWFDAIKADHDALKDAARLALDALEKSTRYFNIVRLGESRLKDSEMRGDCHTAMNALKAVL